MNTNDWLDAARGGRVKNDFVDIEIGDAIIGMSTGAATIDGQVRSIDCYTQQLVGEVLAIGDEPLLLPTAPAMAERHRQATVKVPILPMDVVHATAEQWGERWWQAICHATGRAGAWDVSDAGKSWVLNQLSAPDAALCEGMMADSVAGMLGIPCGPAGADSVFAVRVPGAPQLLAGRHNLRQIDYSGHGFWLRPTCEIGGKPSLTREWLAAQNLPARHPGIPLLAEAPEWLQLLQRSIAVPDTLRSIPHLMDSVTTIVTPLDIFGTLGRIYPQMSRASKIVLTAHVGLETGEGKLMKCFNAGNRKGRPDGSNGRSWQFFACGEEFELSYALKVAQDPRCTIVRQYKRDDVYMASVHIVPDHPACCFAAFESLDQGIADHVQLIQLHFPTAWARAIAGDATGYATNLGLGHYYTAPIGPYAAGVTSLARQYDVRFPT